MKVDRTDETGTLRGTGLPCSVGDMTNSQRELTVLVDGRPSHQVSKIDVHNYGDVASAWDARLVEMITTIHALDLPAQMVWTDTGAPVMTECPTCQSTTFAVSFFEVDDDDCVVCRDCRWKKVDRRDEGPALRRAFVVGYSLHMTNTTNINGMDYRVRVLKGQRYVEVKVENLTPGMKLDQGIFKARTVAMWRGTVNPNTWDILLEGGLGYIETRGANVRVWI